MKVLNSHKALQKVFNIGRLWEINGGWGCGRAAAGRAARSEAEGQHDLSGGAPAEGRQGKTVGADKIFTLNLQGMVFFLDKGAVGA